jgi:hypothetical protein
MGRPATWDALPLFADDKAIGTALLGPERAGEFKGQATLLERRGFPKAIEKQRGWALGGSDAERT